MLYATSFFVPVYCTANPETANANNFLKFRRMSYFGRNSVEYLSVFMAVCILKQQVNWLGMRGNTYAHHLQNEIMDGDSI